MAKSKKYKAPTALPTPTVEHVLMERARTYRYAVLLGISIGALFSVGGFVLALLGLSGSTHIVVEAGGLNARLANASPGAVFALLGIIVLLRYKPKMHDDLIGGSPTETSTTTERRAVYRALEQPEPGSTSYKKYGRSSE